VAGRDQVAQAGADVEVPRGRAAVEALVVGDKADVGEADLGAGVLRRDVEGDVSSRPLGLVLDEREVPVEHVPGDALARGQLGDPLGAPVHVLVAVGELGAELVRVAVDRARPPAAHVGDGGVCLLGSVVDREGDGEALRAHDVLLVLSGVW
jgi:hypothetical protein